MMNHKRQLEQILNLLPSTAAPNLTCDQRIQLATIKQILTSMLDDIDRTSTPDQRTHDLQR